jgi:hypothetical protein
MNNKSPAYDRLRRRSEYMPHDLPFNSGLGLINRVKNRKTSEDLSFREGEQAFQSVSRKEESRKESRGPTCKEEQKK